MIDTYFCASNLDALNSFCAGYANVIGPQCGRAAIAEEVLEDGSVIPAQEAAGDTSKYYVCIRSQESISVPSGTDEINAVLGQKILGVWSS
ncbi:MAG TPA: hypothetical protein DD400_05505 [Rhodospirillaceae bacterium]|nr:hypothetical protein [Rhodospirillaceae bacterium]